AGIDVHDHALALSPHDRDSSLHGYDRSQHVQVEDLVEKVGIDLLDRSGIASARIVDQSIDSAEMTVHLNDRLPESGEVGDVHRNRQAAAELLGDLLENIAAPGQQANLPTKRVQRPRSRQ